MIKLDLSRSSVTFTQQQKEQAEAANRVIESKQGAGSDYLGWVNLPTSIDAAQIATYTEQAAKLKAKADIIICIGIGGSYLGARAVLEAMSDSFEMLKTKRQNPLVLFAGQNISEDYTAELLQATKEHSIAAIVVSKSGTTTEPGIAFRIIKAEIEARYGKKEAAERIVAVTDAERGALKTLATTEGYPTFVIPDDVGGRFSVLTPVGLVPLAAGGVNIAELVRGAQDMERATGADIPFDKNPSAQYAAARNILFKEGKIIEMLASYEPKLLYTAEWWKQLFGESEGKEGTGIFPASVTMTADLHSMGQYIQEGTRNMFETVISIEKPAKKMTIGADAENLDGLNFLTGKSLTEVNQMAELGVAIAHTDGGVPNIRITLPEMTEYYIGAMIYFFERACAISGYILGINPFNQPGVEAYKANMFALLEKPGFEEQTKEIKARL